MRYRAIIVLFLMVSLKLYSQETFLCIADSLRIRNEPTINSKQMGSLNLFDMANVIEKTENKTTIDGIEDYWYKIHFNSIDGYVFGGYGVIIKEKYEINSIDDFANLLPSNFKITRTSRLILNYNYHGGVPMIKLDYSITFMNHNFILDIFYRPNSQIDINDVSSRYNLEIRNANNGFGIGSSYTMLKNTNSSYVSELTTIHGNQGRYFFLSWGSEYTYDIANFLFETNFDGIFNGIIISPLNLWLDNKDFETIGKINNRYIDEARTNRTKESILYQIFYEIILRLKIN